MSSSRAYYAISPASAAAARDVCYNSVASLTFLVWHFFVTLDDEVQYIWTMRNMNQFKWLYFLLRYPVILAHVTHNSFIERLANGSNPPLLCGIWYNYVWAFLQFLATLLELILAFRVFAFYNRSKKVAFLLSTVILMEAAGTARSISLQQTADFYGTCLLLPLTRNVTYQSILGLIVHCTLIGLTLFKYFLAFRAGWGKSPLVALVVRHGTIVYTIILFLFVSEAIMHNSESERGAALFLFVIIVCIVACLLMSGLSVLQVSWTTSLISISGCRMILSMERLGRGEILAESAPLLFTSGINVGTADPRSSLMF